MKRFLGLLLTLALLLCGCTAAAPAEPEPTEAPVSGMEIMEKLNIGWNLGNTFDAPDGETAWGNVFTEEALLQTVKELGFDTIRIPVSWGHHVSAAPDYTIDPEYLARVDTVVNQALNAGLYVIINSHHDNDIYYPAPENAQQGMEYLHAVWTQVAEHFKNADHHLIFQTMNEPRIEGASYEWDIGCTKQLHKDILETVNQLNQTALDAIRATGEKNADRFVIVSCYAGKVKSACNPVFRMPEDSAENRLILSVHIYSPYNLCLNLDPKRNSFQEKDLGDAESQLKTLQIFFLRRGIPVVIDEMGCTNKNNPEARESWAKAFIALTDSYGVPCVVWDNGYVHVSGNDNFGLIDRVAMKIHPESECVYNGLMSARQRTVAEVNG